MYHGTCDKLKINIFPDSWTMNKFFTIIMNALNVKVESCLTCSNNDVVSVSIFNIATEKKII